MELEIEFPLSREALLILFPISLNIPELRLDAGRGSSVGGPTPGSWYSLVCCRGKKAASRGIGAW